MGFLRVWASSHTGSVGRRAGSSSARPHGEGTGHGELGPFPRRPPVPPAWLRGGGSGTNPPRAAQTGLCARGCPGPLGAVLFCSLQHLEQWPEAGRRQRVSSEPAPRGAGTERPCPACWALPPGGALSSAVPRLRGTRDAHMAPRAPSWGLASPQGVRMGWGWGTPRQAARARDFCALILGGGQTGSSSLLPAGGRGWPSWRGAQHPGTGMAVVQPGCPGWLGAGWGALTRLLRGPGPPGTLPAPPQQSSVPPSPSLCPVLALTSQQEGILLTWRLENGAGQRCSPPGWHRDTPVLGAPPACPPPLLGLPPQGGREPRASPRDCDNHYTEAVNV